MIVINVKRMVTSILGVSVILASLASCDLSLGGVGEDIGEGLRDIFRLPNGDETRGIFFVGESSYNGCVEADRADGKPGFNLPGKLNGSVTIDNPVGSGTAEVSGLIDVDSTTGLGEADITLNFNDWESEGVRINGEGDFVAEITVSTAGLQTTADVDGEYVVTMDGTDYDYTADFEMIIQAGISSSYSFDGEATIDGTTYEFDSEISADLF